MKLHIFPPQTQLSRRRDGPDFRGREDQSIARPGQDRASVPGWVEVLLDSTYLAADEKKNGLVYSIPNKMHRAHPQGQGKVRSEISEFVAKCPTGMSGTPPHLEVGARPVAHVPKRVNETMTARSTVSYSGSALKTSARSCTTRILTCTWWTTHRLSPSARRCLKPTSALTTLISKLSSKPESYFRCLRDGTSTPGSALHELF